MHSKNQKSILFFFFVVVMLLQGQGLFAQNRDRDKDDDENITGTELRGIIYQNEFQGGFSFNTNGYSINLRRSWAPNAFYERGFELDVVMIRHQKEINSHNYNYYASGGSSYVYGKLNSLYAIRLGVLENREIAEKIDIGSIEINYLYSGGLSIGGVKPIFLEISQVPPGTGYKETKVERYDPNKHSYDQIYGGTPFIKGFEEIKIYPGIYAKFALNFDYKVSTKKIGTLETGVVVDYYFKKVPIMAKVENYSYYIAFYLSVNFGKKWN